jgi:hypothetical protein
MLSISKLLKLLKQNAYPPLDALPLQFILSIQLRHREDNKQFLHIFVSGVPVAGG